MDSRDGIIEKLLAIARSELSPSQRAMMGARLMSARTRIQQMEAIVHSLKAKVR